MSSSTASLTRVTLTGREPLAHPDLLALVQAFRTATIGIGICTNATLITDD